jgi:murein L,D-transpeptidase YcbB/YkuD
MRFGAAFALCAALVLAPCVGLTQPVPATIQALAAEALRSPVAPAGPVDERGWLDRFYRPRAYAPAWTASAAAAALNLLGQARLQGLDPQDYGADALARQLHADGADSARIDVALTAAMMHYLADLHFGRVRSEYRTGPPEARPAPYDPVERLRAGLGAGQLEAMVQAAEPPFRQYGRVKAALAHYRELASQPYPVLPMPHPGAAPGGDYPAAQALFERLGLLGDLPAATPPPPAGNYSVSMKEGVQRFQARHGLAVDGVLGPATIAALNVQPGVRVRQFELTLERLRWLPDVGAGPLIVVNLPDYHLWALHGDAAGPPLESRVVVGAAVKTETPLFVGQMRYLEFNPYWNVPRSILAREILPRLERDPDYLAHNDMETVPPSAGLADLRAGRARVRQRPGPKNPLGAIKFAMPNPMDIYLHSTPARELFQRSRRDLSHGCIRVEQAAALAEYVLGGQGPWDAEAIQRALQPGPTRRVDLVKSIPVVLFYATAAVDNAGRARFAADIYGRDSKLRRALEARERQAFLPFHESPAAPGFQH